MANSELKAVLRNTNCWCVCKLRQRSELDQNWNQFMDEDADEMRQDIQDHLSAVVMEEMIEGEVGAVATPDVNADGHRLMKFTSEPFHCEERQDLVVESQCLNPVGGALFCVVLGFVLMEKISEENSLPKGCNKAESRRLKAKKISGRDHDHIIEEIIRREFFGTSRS